LALVLAGSPANAVGIEAEVAGGLALDNTATGPNGQASGPIMVGLGAAVLHGPLTAGARMDFVPGLVGHDHRYYLADLGGHLRASVFKLTAVAEIGAHQIDARDPGSAVLLAAGARVSADLTGGRGPAIGWWADLHYDIGTATVGTDEVGGALFSTGIQIGLDMQSLDHGMRR
jgi:hypothetical protein